MFKYCLFIFPLPLIIILSFFAMLKGFHELIFNDFVSFFRPKVELSDCLHDCLTQSTCKLMFDMDSTEIGKLYDELGMRCFSW